MRAVSMNTGVCSAVAVGVIAAMLGCADIETIEDIAYDDRFGDSTMMDIYRPAEAAATDARPAIFMVHGGGWSGGSRALYRDHAARFADAGYVVASISYRLVPEGAFPNSIHDVMCALAFFQSQADVYGFDANRVAVTGYSAGGHLSSLAAVGTEVPGLQPDCAAGTPAAPAAVIAGAGPQDMTLYPDVPAVVDFLGGTLDEVPGTYREASPLTHASASSPPFLFIHGTDDVFVELEHSKRMAAALDAAGVETRMLELRGTGHILNVGPDAAHWQFVITSTDTAEAWAATLDFLDDTVGAP